ncbi:hypothetical protein Bbelb_338100 [Branchiostoma belcheri]|nr:hypothetical protein Bbelb_338100 [Branchiostoma belcheri]
MVVTGYLNEEFTGVALSHVKRTHALEGIQIQALRMNARPQFADFSAAVSQREWCIGSLSSVVVGARTGHRFPGGSTCLHADHYSPLRIDAALQTPNPALSPVRTELRQQRTSSEPSRALAD